MNKRNDIFNIILACFFLAFGVEHFYFLGANFGNRSVDILIAIVFSIAGIFYLFPYLRPKKRQGADMNTGQPVTASTADRSSDSA